MFWLEAVNKHYHADGRSLCSASRNADENTGTNAARSTGKEMVAHIQWTQSVLSGYRLHVRLTIGSLTIDVGSNPLLPGGEEWFWAGLEVFADLVEECVQGVMIDVIALFLEYSVAKGLSMIPVSWIPAVVAMAFKAGTQFYFLLKDWGDSIKMLAVALANFLMGIVSLKVSIAVKFIETLFTLVYGRTLSTLWSLEGKLAMVAEPLQLARTWVDYMELAMDVGFGISALVRYLDLVGVF